MTKIEMDLTSDEAHYLDQLLMGAGYNGGPQVMHSMIGKVRIAIVDCVVSGM